MARAILESKAAGVDGRQSFGAVRAGRWEPVPADAGHDPSAHAGRNRPQPRETPPRIALRPRIWTSATTDPRPSALGIPTYSEHNIFEFQRIENLSRSKDYLSKCEKIVGSVRFEPLWLIVATRNSRGGRLNEQLVD